MALDAIIFDFDGTLVDTTDVHAHAWYLTLERFGYGVGEDRLRREIGKSGSVFVPSLLGDQIEAEQGDDLRDSHDEIYMDLVTNGQVKAFPCAERLVRRAGELGFKTALSTGSQRESVERVIEVTGLNVFDLVDAAVTDTEVSSGKPGPEPVLAAARELGLAPSQCALVGDTPFDVESAHRAGAVTIGVAEGAYSSEELVSCGARVAYDSVEVAGEQLEEAARRCSPGVVHLSQHTIEGLMDEALEQGRRALASGNLPVGTVVADGDGSIVTRAFSRTETSGNFLDHAEMLAFRDLVGRISQDKRDRILVSTFEPCVMCFGAAMDARVETIIYGLEGPSNGGAARCRPMRSPGMIPPRIISGVQRNECLDLFKQWRDRHPESPFVTDLLSRV